MGTYRVCSDLIMRFPFSSNLIDSSCGPWLHQAGSQRYRDGRLGAESLGSPSQFHDVTFIV